jgi:hypothetical protein
LTPAVSKIARNTAGVFRPILRDPVEGRRLSADPFAIPASSVLAYGKYAPRGSPSASLGFDRNTPAFWTDFGIRSFR